jgi:hypothetical protein
MCGGAGADKPLPYKLRIIVGAGLVPARSV